MVDDTCQRTPRARDEPPDPLAWFGGMIDHCYDYAEAAKAKGRPIVGIMCEFTPREIILAAGADLHHVSGLIQEGVSRVRETHATLLVCKNAPDVTKKVIERAMTPGGHKDRELVFRIMGLLPVPGEPGLLERLGRKG